MANVYEKLQTARVDLQTVEIKKSGKNAFAGYEYHELSDFIPQINRIFMQQKLTSIICFTPELATLTLVNCEKPEETIVFTSPMATAALKGCHDVQNLGAVQTYLRRYLYTTAMEIVEHDALDAGAGKSETAKPPQNSRAAKPPAAPPQAPAKPATQSPEDANARKALWATCREAGLTDDNLIKAWILHSYADNQRTNVLQQSTKEVPMGHIKMLTSMLKSGKDTAQSVAVYVDSKRVPAA